MALGSGLAKIREVPAERWWDLGFILLLLGLSAAFFHPLLDLKRAYYTLDFAPQVVPYFQWLHQKFSSGQAPLWSQDLMLGYPFLDEGLSGMFYPPQRLLLTYFDAVPALLYLYIFHTALAALGAYFFCRSLGLRPGPALLAGVVAGFGGGMTFSQHHPANFASLAWLPWQFLGLQLCASDSHARRALGSSLLGLALGMAVNGGHLVISLYGLGALALFAWQRWRAGKPGTLGRLLGAGLWAGVLAACLCGGQLMATRRLVEESVRSQPFSYEQASENSLSPASLTGLVLPFAFGHPNDNSFLGAAWSLGTWTHQGLLLYIGLCGLVLAWLGWEGKDPRGRPFLWAMLFLLLYALGRHFPLHQALSHLPLVGHFRGPMKAASLAPFLLGVLAALGLQRVLEGEVRRPWLAPAALAACFLLAWGGMRAAQPKLEKFGRGIAAARASHPDLPSRKPASYYQDKFRRFHTGLKRHLLEQAAFALAAALLLALALALAGKNHLEPGALLLSLLAFAELSRNGSAYFPALDKSLYERPPASAKALKGAAKGRMEGRFFSWGWTEMVEKAYPKGATASDPSPEFRVRELLSGDTGLPLGLASFGGYSPLPLARHAGLLSGSNDFDPRLDRRERDRVLLDRRRFLDLGAVRFILSPTGLNWRGLASGPRPKGGPALKIQKNTQALPLAWLAGEILRADSPEEALEMAAGSKGRQVVLESGPEMRLDGRGELKWLEQGDLRWRLRLRARESGFLFLSRTHYPEAWEARVDGARAELLPANGTFTGLWVPAGSHEVIVEYKDPILPWAKAAHALGWLALFLVPVGLLAGRKP